MLSGSTVSLFSCNVSFLSGSNSSFTSCILINCSIGKGNNTSFLNLSNSVFNLSSNNWCTKI